MTKMQKYWFSYLMIVIMYAVSDSALAFAILGIVLLIGNFLVDDKP